MKILTDLLTTENFKPILGGIFDRENIETKITDLEKISKKKILKDKI